MKTRDLAHITSVKVLDGFRLKLRFKDSARRIVDLKPILWGSMFAPMLNPKEFRKVRVNPDFGCIEWPNGADLCPDALRDWHHSMRTPKPEKKEHMKLEKAKMNKAEKAIAKELKCTRLFKLKVKSKKTGKWEFRLFGCSRKSLESTVKFYREKFGKQAKIVQA